MNNHAILFERFIEIGSWSQVELFTFIRKRLTGKTPARSARPFGMGSEFR
jgi:hypothetical protein